MYVVWVGRKPGVYATWPECETQVKGFPCAKFRGFDDEATARAAFAEGRDPGPEVQPGAGELFRGAIVIRSQLEEGGMSYLGLDAQSNNEVFKVRSLETASKDVAAFLGLCHALALSQRSGRPAMPVYSSSDLALRWIRQRRCGALPSEFDPNSRVRILVRRADSWLDHHGWHNPLLKLPASKGSAQSTL